MLLFFINIRYRPKRAPAGKQSFPMWSQEQETHQRQVREAEWTKVKDAAQKQVQEAQRKQAQETRIKQARETQQIASKNEFSKPDDLFPNPLQMLEPLPQRKRSPLAIFDDVNLNSIKCGAISSRRMRVFLDEFLEGL